MRHDCKNSSEYSIFLPFPPVLAINPENPPKGPGGDRRGRRATGEREQAPSLMTGAVARQFLAFAAAKGACTACRGSETCCVPCFKGFLANSLKSNGKGRDWRKSAENQQKPARTSENQEETSQNQQKPAETQQEPAAKSNTRKITRTARELCQTLPEPGKNLPSRRNP